MSVMGCISVYTLYCNSASQRSFAKRIVHVHDDVDLWGQATDLCTCMYYGFVDKVLGSGLIYNLLCHLAESLQPTRNLS